MLIIIVLFVVILLFKPWVQIEAGERCRGGEKKGAGHGEESRAGRVECGGPRRYDNPGEVGVGNARAAEAAYTFVLDALRSEPRRVDA